MEFSKFLPFFPNFYIFTQKLHSNIADNPDKGNMQQSICNYLWNSNECKFYA